jgi:hypothetical protein
LVGEGVARQSAGGHLTKIGKYLREAAEGYVEEWKASTAKKK